MAIKYEKITPGSVLLDIHSYRMGNTTIRRLGCWRVKVLEIVEGGARVSWNSNGAVFWPISRLEKLYVKPPREYREQNPYWQEGHIA